MKSIFGPHTGRVAAFLTDLQNLSAEEVSRVASAWKQASNTDRVRAWAELYRASSDDQRYRIRAAASSARAEAMSIAHSRERPDWAFWTAVWDAAAAIAAGEQIGKYYDVLTAPLAAVMPRLAQGRNGQPGLEHAVPAQPTAPDRREARAP
jgi:thioesterase domain-containing protein